MALGGDARHPTLLSTQRKWAELFERPVEALEFAFVRHRQGVARCHLVGVNDQQPRFLPGRRFGSETLSEERLDGRTIIDSSPKQRQRMRYWDAEFNTTCLEYTEVVRNRSHRRDSIHL